jgi:hypothetical protein
MEFQRRFFPIHDADDFSERKEAPVSEKAYPFR